MTPSSAPPPEWFVAEDGERRGPYTRGQLLERIADGQLGPEQYVLRKGEQAWRKLSEVAELAGIDQTHETASHRSDPGSRTDALSQSGAGTLFPAVPGYAILRKLGQGGMGVVYEAEDLARGERVALKMLTEAKDQDDSTLRRFRREARALARIEHPNIVRVHDIGEADGRPYMTMELIEVGTLADALANVECPLDLTVSLMEKVARAVRAVHESGIIHRDLKPANILLTHEGEPKLTDFGIAKDHEQTSLHTQTGSVLGTASYMAPEQARGETRAIDARTDVYALGVILYQMLTGEVPFRGPFHAVIYHVIHTEPEPPRSLRPEVPAELEAICLRCMAKEPGERYQSALELAEALETFSRTRGAREPEATTVELPAGHPPGAGATRSRSKLLIGAAIGGVLIALLVLFMISGSPGTSEKSSPSSTSQQIAKTQREAPPVANTPTWAATEVAYALREPSDRLLGMAFSPDGKRLCVAKCRQTRGVEFKAKIGITVTTYDSGGKQKGEPVRLEGHLTKVGEAVFSPDLTRLASAGPWERNLKVWDLSNGQLLRAFQLKGPVDALAFSPDGKRIAFGSSHAQQETVRIHDIENEKEAITLKGRTGRNLMSIAFSPDGERIATGGYIIGSPSNGLKLWNAKTGEEIRTFQGLGSPRDGIDDIAFSPDGIRIIVATFVKNAGEVLNVRTGNKLITLKGHTRAVRTVAFSPDGKHIATGSEDKTVRIWDAEKGAEVLTLREKLDEVNQVAFSPDGRHLAALCKDNSITVWRPTGQ